MMQNPVIVGEFSVTERSVNPVAGALTKTAATPHGHSRSILRKRSSMYVTNPYQIITPP